MLREHLFQQMKVEINTGLIQSINLESMQNIHHKLKSIWQGVLDNLYILLNYKPRQEAARLCLKGLK